MKLIGICVVPTSVSVFSILRSEERELDVYSFNPRAEKAYLKAGFKKEGILRDSILDGDKYADDILMAMLEDDWRRIKGIYR